MTPEEWQRCPSPYEMLAYLRPLPTSARKYRLYACAVVRQLWDELSDERSRQAVEIAERFADGKVTRRQLHDGSVRLDAGSVPGGGIARKTLLRSARMAANDVTYAHRSNLLPALLRCIFRHPLNPPIVVASEWLAWQNGMIPRMASAIYSERAMPQGTFDPAKLLVLSDALHESGCDIDEMLAHLRQPGIHVRGCWVIDLILGKK